jgi:Nif-specific regulatory protein
LRERREDIPPLIDHFLDRYNKENSRNLKYISRDILNMLLRYSWPGNVRELENAIERAVVMSQDENFTEDLLPLSIRAQVASTRPSVVANSPEDLAGQLACKMMDDHDLGGGDIAIWSSVMDDIERSLISEALKRCGGVKIKAADYLGINRNTLNKKYNDLRLGEDATNPAMTNSAT